MATDLLGLARLSLLTDKGKSLTDGDVNELDVLDKLEEYKERYPDLDLSSITSEVQNELSGIYDNQSNTENLTREQRRQRRQKNREARKAAREQKRVDRQEDREQRLRDRLEEAGVEDPDAERTRIGAEIAILLSKLRSNKPVATSFTISGRLVDTIGSEPIYGADIMLGVNPVPLGEGATKNISLTEADSPLSSEDFEILGNITSADFAALDETTKQQLTDNLNNFRLAKLEAKANLENKNLRNKKGKVRRAALTTNQLQKLIEKDEKYAELEGITVEVNPNNLLYVPNRDFLNPNFNKEKNESNNNLKRITGNINDPLKQVTTDENGSFKIKIIVPIIPSTQKCPVDIAILSKGGKVRNPKDNSKWIEKGFMQGTFFLLNGDRTLKTELGIKNVVSLDDASKILSEKYKETIDDAQDKINSLALDGFEWVISQKKIALNNITNTIKSKLLPLVISLLLAFGISKLTEMNRRVCPSPDALNDVIRRRNRVIRQLNQIYKVIIVNTAIAAAFIYLSKYLKGARLQLDALPFPQAVGTPPAKDFGGLVFSQPYSTTAKIQKLNEVLEELSENNKEYNKAILVNLVFVIAGTITILLLLRAIDQLIGECADATGSEIELEEINEELLELGQEQEDDGNPVLNDINGFILSVETDNKNPVGTLQRRFAVAKNSQGVTLLKGEPSFSSSDQILIDELVFYIQQNDLKAV